MPSHEERTLAALAHAGIVLNIAGLGGIWAAGLIWATQRDRSPFVARHALQALLFQLIGLVLALVGGLAWGGCLALGLLPVALRPDLYTGGPPAFFWVALLAGGVLLGFILGSVAYALVATVQAARGQPFSYLLVDRLAAPHIVMPQGPITGPLPDMPSAP